jgi:hypothetical protein
MITSGAQRAQSTPAANEWRGASFLPMRHAAAILGISRAGVYNLGKTGALQFRRLAGRTLVITASLAALVDANEPWTPSPTAGAAGRARRSEMAQARADAEAGVAS